MFAAGVGSVMIAHLYIPAIDTTSHTATSLSQKAVTGLLRDKLHFQGLTFTDALGMKGVAKFFPGGQIAAQSLIAGNDVLCLPEDVAQSIAKIKEAIDSNRISWQDIYAKCKKVLLYKYWYGVAAFQTVDTTDLVRDLNAKAANMRRLVADNAITLLSNKNTDLLPLPAFGQAAPVAYLGIGIDSMNAFAQRMKADYHADVYFFGYNAGTATIPAIVDRLKNHYRTVVIGIHNYRRYPAGNFGISAGALDLIREVQQNNAAILFDFGNPYALKNFSDAANLVACYEDDSITQLSAADALEGKIVARGTLPVTVCDNYRYGSGIIDGNLSLPFGQPATVGLSAAKLSVIDSLANDGIKAGAYPGCVVLVAKEGKIVFDKAYGKYTYDGPQPVNVHTIYDMASVTKVCATTLAVMKLFDEGKIKLKATLGTYLPWVRKSNKSRLTIKNVLLHQAGLVPFIPFYKAVIDPVTGEPLPRVFATVKKEPYTIRVAQGVYLRRDYRDSMVQIILKSKLGPLNKYVYSDNDFIFLGKIVEAVSGMSLDTYVDKWFYKPMGLSSTGFLPREKFDTNRIAPTEYEKQFRMQLLHGDVHDPGAAMFGDVAGHAGLFSDADNLAAIMQMLLNGGTFKGKSYIKASTIKLFSAYNSAVSRRGFGFDKPEKDNLNRREPYPARSVSPLAIGHTGYTGTAVWADPKYQLVFIFLSNRVNPDGGDNEKLQHMNIRGKIQESIYEAMKK